MTEEPTLDEAKALIERTKALRPTCLDCTVVEVTGPWFRLVQGEADPFAGLQSALNQAARAHLAESEWELSPSHAGPGGADVFTKRCETCATTHAYPWAKRLDAEKVLEFMQMHRRNYGGVFHLSDLVVTL